MNSNTFAQEPQTQPWLPQLSELAHLGIIFSNLAITVGFWRFLIRIREVTPDFVAVLAMESFLFSFGMTLYRRLERPKEVRPRWKNEILAGLVLAVLNLSSTVVIVQGLESKETWRQLGWGLFVVLLALAWLAFIIFWWIVPYKPLLHTPIWRNFGVGAVLIGVPIALSWGGFYGYWHRYSFYAENPIPGPSPLQETSKIPVAVVLSAGGYRAAAFHAGVLGALDEGEVTIDYLSTVSGGAIVGAYYALHERPVDAFLDLLRKRPRGFRDIFLGKKPADHFARVYFGDRILGDGCRLTLLIHTVAVHSGDLKIFECHPGGATAGQTDAPVRVADAVAASGLIPIPRVLDPVKIGESYYMDGAFRDSLGMEGLLSYLKTPAEGPRPAIILVSNATMDLEAEVEKSPPKMSPLDPYVNGYTMLMAKARAHFFSQYTGPYVPGRWVEQPFPIRGSEIYGLKPEESPRVVYLFVLSLHKGEHPGGDKCEAEAARVAKSLGRSPTHSAAMGAKIDTLREPTPQEVDLLSCVGKWLMRSRLTTLQCVLGALRENDRDPLRRCRPTR